MTLDLHDLTAGWDCPAGETAARIVPGLDGRDVVQLRVDVGVLQMELDGRPDGARYRGMLTVLEFIQQRLRRGRRPQENDWDEVQRELNQFNYRRMAFTHLAEQVPHDANDEVSAGYLRRAIRDIDHCLLILRTLDEHSEEGCGSNAMLLPALIFNRSRMLARLLTIEQRYEEAIEEAEAGIAALERALEEAGLDEEHRTEDAGVAYLRQLTQRIREQYGVQRTLQERLADAIAAEDFETAARIRDQLEQRRRQKRGLSASEN
jgi:hypothetical protein